MIGDILNAVIQEAKAFLASNAGTILLKTDYKASNLPSYSMPLLLIDLLEAPDTYQYPGGATRVDWNFALNAYNYAPDPKGDDTTGYSNQLLDIIDSIRQHFSVGDWTSGNSPTMTDLLYNYGFRFTLSGITQADALDEDGLVKGYKILFETSAIDNSTNELVESSQVLEYVTQVGNPPF